MWFDNEKEYTYRLEKNMANRTSTELKSLVTVTLAHTSFPGSGTASAILRRPTLIPRNCTDNKRISENWDVAGAKKFDGLERIKDTISH